MELSAVLVLQRRLLTLGMLPQPVPVVTGAGGRLAPLLVVEPGDRGRGGPALGRQDDLKQLADLRHGRSGPIFSPTRAGPP